MQPPTNNVPSRPKHRLRSLVILVAWLVLLGVIAHNRQTIIDWWKLKHYQVPAVVADLAAQDGMTDYARKVFYVNQPALDSQTNFNTFCPNNGGEQTIVLGCYHSNQNGIFLLTVSDQRLNGVEQVTAAHEMLHAAYDRLSTVEKNQVNAMLLDYYNHGLQDQRIINTIASYKKTEPNDLVNEMHSIFGTEVPMLPAGLENYYKRYFTDRAAIAAYGAQYQGEFTSRQTAVAQADSQLVSLKQQIDALETDINTKQAAVDAQQQTLNDEKTTGDVKTYNASVPSFNALVDDYNNQVNTLKGLIGQYNDLVAHRNAIALEENQLAKELTSDTTTIQR